MRAGTMGRVASRMRVVAILLAALAGLSGWAAGRDLVETHAHGRARPDDWGGVGLPARLALARGGRAERLEDPSCVDEYYRAAVLASAELDGPGQAGALRLYNHALARCLHAAGRHGRLDPRSHLLVRTPAGMTRVPIDHEGFVWSPADFDELVEPAMLGPIEEQQRRRVRAGLGAPQAVLRHRHGDASDALLGNPTAFAATAVLHPDLDAWLRPAPGQVPRDRLQLVDSLRVDGARFHGRAWPLAADLDAPAEATYARYGGQSFRLMEILQPEQAIPFAGLYMMEPYQPGKIPVILVHGLAASPWTWCDMAGDLRADPEFRRRYQLWTFTYPTGLGFLFNAGLLRQSLDRAIATLDPAGADPALRQMVLVGHSMGGLLSTLQVTHSDGGIADVFLKVPFDDLAFPDPAIRERFRALMHFEPRPYIRRVIYIATPHRGSNLSNALIQGLIRGVVRMPGRRESDYAQIVRANPGAVRWRMRRQPTSVDLLEDDHPLLEAILRLPRAPWVRFHSIIGVARRAPITGREGDGVVPFTSAQIGGVDSEAHVDARHVVIHHAPETVAEVKRILGLEPARR